MSAYALSVDYGTSNTVAVLRWPDGKTRPLLFDGSPLLPSAVFASPEGQLSTGRDAVNSARLDPTRFEPNPKRHVDEMDLLLGDTQVPLTAVVAATLTRVAQEARHVAGVAVGELIMTHPAEWGAARRQVLVDAARAAGLPQPSLVPEPVAAGTYFTAVLGKGVPEGSCVVVYDLGAGTFDAAVVRRTATGFETLAYRGLDDIGGVDVDDLVVQLLGGVVEPAAPAEWARLLAPQTMPDRRAARQLRDDARMLKERLSRESSGAILVPIVDRDLHVTRAELEQRALALVAQTVAVTVATMKAARTPRDRITGLFLVGGSTRMPLVATELHRATAIAPTVLDQPELVVAEGALLIETLAGPSRTAPATAPTSPAPADTTWPPPAPAPQSQADTTWPTPSPVPAPQSQADTTWPTPSPVPAPQSPTAPPTRPMPANATTTWQTQPAANPPPSQVYASRQATYPGQASAAPVSPAMTQGGFPVSAVPAAPVSPFVPAPPVPLWPDQRPAGFTTTSGSVTVRAALRLLLVPVFFLLGFIAGRLSFTATHGQVVPWVAACLVWGYGLFWVATSIVRMVTAGKQPTRLLFDHLGATVTVQGQEHTLPWSHVARLVVRRRGANLRPVLVAVPRQSIADPFWRARLTRDGTVRIADLKTLRAAPPAVLAAAEPYM